MHFILFSGSNKSYILQRYQRKQAGICYKIQNTCWMGKGVTNFKYHTSCIGSTNSEWQQLKILTFKCQWWRQTTWKAILIGRITEHFTNFPRLKEDPWFLPLFKRAPRGQKRAMPDRDATGLEPPTQRPCFDLETLPIENFTQIMQLEYPIASSSRIQLPFQPVPSSYFNTFSL